nr:protein SUPPRESSOR OF npr1-1, CONSTITUTIVE 1-like [Ipomoea batatas]
MDKQSIAQKSPVMHGIDPHKLTAECKQLYCIVKGLTRDVTLRLSDEIFMIKDYDLFILREEMLRFLAMETIDASSILFFMWLLYDQFGLARKNTYGFLDPNSIQSKLASSESRTKYISTTIEEGKKNVILRHMFTSPWYSKLFRRRN